MLNTNSYRVWLTNTENIGHEDQHWGFSDYNSWQCSGGRFSVPPPPPRWTDQAQACLGLYLHTNAGGWHRGQTQVQTDKRGSITIADNTILIFMVKILLSSTGKEGGRVYFQVKLTGRISRVQTKSK